MIASAKFKTTGMRCEGCENRIIDAIGKCKGVDFVNADFRSATVSIRFDDEKTSLSTILKELDAAGYHSGILSEAPEKKLAAFLKSILAFTTLVLAIVCARIAGSSLNLPEVNSKAGYGLIFFVGLLTGLHCVGMCGGFVVGYASQNKDLDRSAFLSHLTYGIGKTLSYAMFGGLFGAMGAIFQITPLISGISVGLAGAFLIIFGLSMLDFLGPLKKLRFRQPVTLIRYAGERTRNSRSPFFIGFFSGFLLGCGPLQVMYVTAAANGDAIEGAFILAVFSLGTLPVLLGFGFVAQAMSSGLSRRFVHASGVMLIVMGMMMLNGGISRAATGDITKSPTSKCCCHK